MEHMCEDFAGSGELVSGENPWSEDTSALRCYLAVLS